MSPTERNAKETSGKQDAEQVGSNSNVRESAQKVGEVKTEKRDQTAYPQSGKERRPDAKELSGTRKETEARPGKSKDAEE